MYSILLKMSVLYFLSFRRSKYSTQYHLNFCASFMVFIYPDCEYRNETHWHVLSIIRIWNICRFQRSDISYIIPTNAWHQRHI